MAIDTPARIAIVGAGPIGLEAALYARFLGYDVDVYERGGVAENVLRWGHVRLFSPFGLNRSNLGLAALTAQDAGFRAPVDEALLTGRQWAEEYLLPLAQTDLLADSLHLQTEVVSIGRAGALKSELVGSEERADNDFLILVRDAAGERLTTADAVIDTSGTYGNPNWLGPGGIPAIGEQAARPHVEYLLPDVLGKDFPRFAGLHTLLLGSGYSAATTAVALAQLTEEVPGTRLTWVTRRPAEENERGGPVRTIADDRLLERRRLAEAANQLAREHRPSVVHWPGTWVEAIHWEPNLERFAVRLVGEHAGPLEVERVVANVGYRPDTELYEELQVHTCYATEGPMKLAAALAGQAGADCLDQRSCGPETLLNPEPDFYILGAKSYGRNSRFLFSLGLEQIRELFTIIGDRPDLNLYATIQPIRS